MLGKDNSFLKAGVCVSTSTFREAEVVEAEAILKALLLLSPEFAASKVLLFSDNINLDVIRTLRGAQACSWATQPVISDIFLVSLGLSSISFYFASRSSNVIAHTLATRFWAIDGVFVWSSPHDVIRDFFSE
uniref:RNase H type-1 domain-containing protein n=1 Tax=Nelumbo nucifera TaxID=4432 RepID=A0A822Z1K7_NELNU|nr:TPA_asm: hypothetical protein HUJ06_008010 [Nelumbo nucifera]